MRSKLLSALVAGALITSSSVAAAQLAPEPARDSELGTGGESALRGSGSGGLAIFLLLIVVTLAIFMGRGNEDRPISP